MSSNLNYANLKSRRTASSLVSEGVNSGQLDLDEIKSSPVTVKTSRLETEMYNSPRRTNQMSSKSSLSRSLREAIDDEEDLEKRPTESLTQMIQDKQKSSKLTRDISRLEEDLEDMSRMSNSPEKSSMTKTLIQMIQDEKSNKLSRDVSRVREDMSRMSNSPEKSSMTKTLIQMIQDEKSNKLSRDVSRVREDLEDMPRMSSSLRKSSMTKSLSQMIQDEKSNKLSRDVSSVREDMPRMSRLERDLSLVKEDMSKSSKSSEKKSISEMILEAKSKSSGKSKSLSSTIKQKLMREQNSLSSIKFTDLDATVSGDMSSKVLSTESSFLGDLKSQLINIGVVVTGTVSFDDSQNKMLLESYTSKSTPFYIIVKNSNTSSVYFPKSHTVLSRHYGSKSTISDTIPLSDCENLPVCDILYSCDGDFCYLKKTDSKVEMTEFTLAAQKPMVETLHIKGALIARPVVSFEELMSNPTETLSIIEETSDSLFNTDYKNVNQITTDILRKLTSNAFDSINIQNTFQSIFSSLNLQEEQLLAALLETNDSDISKLETERLSQLYKMKEHLLSSMTCFNKVETQVDEVTKRLHHTIDKMKDEIKEYFSGNYPYPITEQVFFEAEERAKGDEPMEFTFIIA